MSVLNTSCSQPTADCGEGEIPIFGSCHKLSDTPSNQDYTIFNSLRNTPNKVVNVLGIQQDYTLPECMAYCKNDTRCGALDFQYEHHDKFDIDYTTRGTCKIGTSYTSLPGTGVKINNDNNINYCGQFYSVQNPDPSNGINIVNAGGNSYYIDGDGKRKDQYPLIQTDYGGANCRTQYSKSIGVDDFTGELMGAYCKDHQDLQTCIDFCNNTDTKGNCNWNLWYRDTQTLKTIAAFFLTLFLFLYFYRYSENITPVLIIFIPFLMYIIINIIRLVIKKKNVGVKEFNNRLKRPSNNCDDTSCINTSYGCSDFLGECDCPYTGN